MRLKSAFFHPPFSCQLSLKLRNRYVVISKRCFVTFGSSVHSMDGIQGGRNWRYLRKSLTLNFLYNFRPVSLEIDFHFWLKKISFLNVEISRKINVFNYYLHPKVHA